MKIIVNPHESVIEQGVIDAEEVVILHGLMNEQHLRVWEKRYIEMGYSIVYIHHYTGDKSYTMGLVKEWSLKPNE